MQAGQPVAQALYAGTRPMPWQQSTGGGAAFDSSFGCALDLDGLAWARSSGGAKVNAKRFGAATPSGSDRRNYNVDQLSLAKGVEHSQRVYSCFSSTSSRFGASVSNTADGPGPGAYFSDVSRQAMVVQNQAPIVSALGRTPLGVSRIVGPGFPGAALPPESSAGLPRLRSSAFASTVPRQPRPGRGRPNSEPGYSSVGQDAQHWRNRGGAGRFGRAVRQPL